jgi:hypothetical protein
MGRFTNREAIMFRAALEIWWLIAGIAFLTAVLEGFVPFSAEEAAGGFHAGRVVGFFIGFVVSGIIAVGVYRWMGVRWPDRVDSLYLTVAVVLGIALTVIAVVMGRVAVHNWTAPILWTAMNVIWVLAYGFILPRVMA